MFITVIVFFSCSEEQKEKKITADDTTENIISDKIQKIDSDNAFFRKEILKIVDKNNKEISQIVDELRDIPGVINVVDVRFYNLERGAYSMTVSSQATGARTYDARTDSYSTEIEYVDNAIKGTPLSMFEIKYPEKDIKVRMATGNDQLVS